MYKNFRARQMLKTVDGKMFRFVRTIGMQDGEQVVMVEDNERTYQMFASELACMGEN